MASGLDLTSFDPLLKEYYTDDMVYNLVYKNNPYLALLNKFENFQGENLPIPLIYGNPQGRSRTFSQAKARSTQTSTKSKRFVLTRKKDYCIATIDNETIEATKSNKGAFLEAMTTEIDGAIQAVTNNMGFSLFRDSSGARSQVSVEPTENVGTFVITLTNADDIVGFETEQEIVIWSAKTGGTQKSSDGSDDEWTIASVDRDAGTFTLTGTYDTNGTIAADDYIFINGDRGLSISGLADWIPDTAPTSGDSFYGVDRSTDVTRLAGLRYDASNVPIEEALVESAARVGREGGRLDHYFMSYSKYADLEKALGAKVTYVDLKTDYANIGFKGIRIHGPRSDIYCVADQNCPTPRVYGLYLDVWKLYSLNKAIRIFETDGNTILRQNDADGIEVRIISYSNLGCRAPGWNVVVKFDS
jgi:hypothetical protein